jgi:hypothetical protein
MHGQVQGIGLPCGKDKMLCRKVVTRSGRGFRGYFPSKKLNRMIEYESLLERDAIKLFESCDEVTWYQEQPTIIYYYQDYLPRKYFPDFELELSNGKTVHVEVKPSSHLATIKLSMKFHLIAQCYQNKAEHFVILTEKELREERCIDFDELLSNQIWNLNKGDNDEALFI